ncbi:BTAD domain-containing putative transcriptional regulator [Streptomyces sp. NPDC000134]|uniref:AfsR/SARP family transcriptional regulator n=1 Tax=Streptomyces sp. NPDC000134 TaxID=3364536 RepID=UPI0036772E47
MVNVSLPDSGLQILKPFEFTNAGRRMPVPLGARRLLAFLALQNDWVDRTSTAEHLWPACTPFRAAANLRSALCQSRRAATHTVIDSSDQRLKLAPSVRVDFHEMREAARRTIEGPVPRTEDWNRLVGDLSRELLPGWTEDWLDLERQWWDQLRLYALESLAQQLRNDHQYLDALQAALAAIAVDPFRETPHRTAMEIHIAEGNIASAIKRYHDYRAFLQRELGVTPSRQMTDLLHAVLEKRLVGGAAHIDGVGR